MPNRFGWQAGELVKASNKQHEAGMAKRQEALDQIKAEQEKEKKNDA